MRRRREFFYRVSFFFFFFIKKGKTHPFQPLSLGEKKSRCVATARVLMPRSVVRLSAGRKELGLGDQALAFLAGANSIFDGDKLLTTKNADREDDDVMFAALGLRPRPAFVPYAAGGESSKGGAEKIQQKA